MKNVNLINQENKKPLLDPLNHSLEDLLKELQYGRPAETQLLIQKWIDEVKNQTTVKNLHLISIDEESRILKTPDGKFIIVKDPIKIEHYENYIMHFTSSKYKGKWHLEDGDTLKLFPDYLTDPTQYKMVLMTTDQNLINQGVQPIDDDFLKRFFNNLNCEKVEMKNIIKH